MSAKRRRDRANHGKRGHPATYIDFRPQPPREDLLALVERAGLHIDDSATKSALEDESGFACMEFMFAHLGPIYATRKQAIATGHHDDVILAGHMNREPLKSFQIDWYGQATANTMYDAMRQRSGTEPAVCFRFPRANISRLYALMDNPGVSTAVARPPAPGRFTAVIVAGGATSIVPLPDE